MWTAGASNIVEADGVTLHHLALGARGLGFFNAHAPCIAALLETKAPFIVWCPGWMQERGRKSSIPMKILSHAEPGSAAFSDFISYEDAADAIVRAVEASEYDNMHITALSERKGEL